MKQRNTSKKVLSKTANIKILKEQLQKSLQAIAYGLCFVLCLCLTFENAFASEPDKKELLKRVERELNLIRTMDTKIIQTSTGQPKATGRLILSRPNKMLLTYDEPVTTSIVADGYNVIFYDKALEQVTYLGLDETPAFFILKDKFSFKDKDLLVKNVKRKNGNVEIIITMKKDPLAGQLTIVFNEKPFFLEKWYITDARRTKTAVILTDTKYNLEVDENLFSFRRPSMRQKVY